MLSSSYHWTQLRAASTVFLTGLTLVVAASCVEERDESSTRANIEAASMAGAAREPEVAVVERLQVAFPRHAEHVLGRFQARGFVRSAGGFVSNQAGSQFQHIEVHLPHDARQTMRITVPSGHEIRVHQVGVEGNGEWLGQAVAYRRAGGSSFWTVTNGGVEEWLHFGAGTITSDRDVVAAWEIEGATPQWKHGAVALMDDHGVARAWVAAPVGFGAQGRRVELRLSVENQRIELFADARGEEVLLDPSWSAVAPTMIGRALPSVTTLPNGNVLVAAGNSSVGYEASAEMYNPATNVWVPIMPMTQRRYGQRDTVLPSGRWLLAGGLTGSFITSTVEIYDPAAGVWLMGTDMTNARALHAQVLLNSGQMLVAGGYGIDGYVASAELYDPVSDMWSPVPDMSLGRVNATSVRLGNGKVLVVGGLRGNSSISYLNTNAEVYDPVSNTWAPTGPLVNPRHSATGALLANGKVLVAGGFGNANSPLSTAELYDPVTNAWTATGARTQAAGQLGGVLLTNGQFLAFGGNNGISTVYANADVYDAVAGIWTSAGTMYSVRMEPVATLLNDGQALIVNGSTDVGYLVVTNSVDRYAPSLLANGASCQIAGQCTSGFCVDGVCCMVSACTASDSCHNVGTCQAGTGVCNNPAKPNGTVCNDNNACTLTDTCQSGSCSGANPVVCSASDACHNVGTCNPSTGLCDNPAKPNGTVCNDNNACTANDSCQNGVCSGAGAVTCTAMDSCHNAGTCDPMTGLCSNPSKPDNTVCNDGNACTLSDTCQSGVCSGANPVVCSASDQCHNAGICDPQTGNCSNPAKPDNTVCNDLDACTQVDSCQNGVCKGAGAITCTAMDQCHEAGTCNSMTGICDNPAKPDGTACDDGNACTQMETCQVGVCNGGTPITCTAPDECHEAGQCNANTGLCDNPAKPNGSPCSVGSCQSGVCTPNGSGGMGGSSSSSSSSSGSNFRPPTSSAGSNSSCRMVVAENQSSSVGFAGMAFAAVLLLRRRRSASR